MLPLFSLFLVAFATSPAYPPYGCKGSPNYNPIYQDPPTFVKQVSNGKLFTTGSASPKVQIIHMWGTPYEMGLAHGQLVKEEAQKLYKDVLAYIEAQVEEAIHFLPKFLRDLIAKEGVNAALDLTHYLTKDYIPDHFVQELKGFAAGAGLDFTTAMRVHMFPELIKAQCSIVGAWGPAVPKAANGSLVQLRALDWATNGPFQEFPALLVYHPSDPKSHSFSILSFVGFVGALTGVSEEPFGICEKVWLAYNGTSSRSGIPWHFMLRDILQFDSSIDDAINRVNNVARTCSIWIGLGEPKNKRFRVMGYSYEQVNVYDDKNFPVYPHHPQLDGLLFVNKHFQPSQDPCLGDLLQANYGKIDAQFLISQATALHQTGDTHAAVYDFGNDKLFVSNAGIYVPGKGATPAYARPWAMVRMSSLWNETRPN